MDGTNGISDYDENHATAELARLTNAPAPAPTRATEENWRAWERLGAESRPQPRRGRRPRAQWTRLRRQLHETCCRLHIQRSDRHRLPEATIERFRGGAIELADAFESDYGVRLHTTTIGRLLRANYGKPVDQLSRFCRINGRNIPTPNARNAFDGALIYDLTRAAQSLGRFGRRVILDCQSRIRNLRARVCRNKAFIPYSPSVACNVPFFIERAIQDAVPGNRNWAGFRLACLLVACGLPRSEIEAAMRRFHWAVEHTGRHRYGWCEAMASIRSALRYA